MHRHGALIYIIMTSRLIRILFDYLWFLTGKSTHCVASWKVKVSSTTLGGFVLAVYGRLGGKSPPGPRADGLWSSLAPEV
jgi:hypothetical protein